MITTLSWLVDLPWSGLALGGIVLVSFWTTVVVHRIEARQRVRLDAEWVKFTGRAR